MGKMLMRATRCVFFGCAWAAPPRFATNVVIGRVRHGMVGCSETEPKLSLDAIASHSLT